MPMLPSIVHAENLVTDLKKENCFLTMPDEKDNTLFYGVELEAYYKPNLRYQHKYYSTPEYDLAERNRLEAMTAETLADFDDRAILKPDGSYEVCTVPATLQFHKQQLWNKYFANSVKYVDEVTEGCGIHIHFSRDALSAIQMARVLVFFNEECNKEFLEKVARRQFFSGCYQKKLMKDGGESSILAQGRDGRCACHISKRNQGKTAEVRIFQSIATPQGLFQCLEFVDAVIAYFKDNGDPTKELHHSDFLAWYTMNQMSKVYPYLENNLVELGLRPRPRAKKVAA